MIKLHFEKLSKYERIKEPCSAAVPFPKGGRSDASGLVVTDGTREMPTQCKITGTWDDGSVKWLKVDFLADLPGSRSKDYFLAPDKPGTDDGLRQVLFDEDKKRIDTGALKLQLARAGSDFLFEKIEACGCIYAPQEISAPLLTDAHGTVWTARIGTGGWERVENGPVRCVVMTRGKHYADGKGAWFDYCLKLYAYAGKPWFTLDYQILNKESGKIQQLSGMELKIRPEKSARASTALAYSNYRSKIMKGENDAGIVHRIDAEQLVNEANEHVPETFYGTFFGTWCDGVKGISATLYQAHQNYPKEIAADQAGIDVRLYPKLQEPLKVYQGMAKTHRLFIHFHTPDETVENINVRSLQFQLEDRPVLETMVYEQSGVFENVFVKNRNKAVERHLVHTADGKGRAYGILHWGDAVDGGYTRQGRGGGSLVWTNNEYDFPHAAMLQYVRTGERRFLDYMLTAARHWMDVDICHHHADPLRQDAQITHSRDHVTGKVKPSHAWVEGLLDYYHQTGDGDAYEAALGIGNNVIRLLLQPSFRQPGETSIRQIGWAMRTFVALYRETNAVLWLEQAGRLVEYFKKWRELSGGWLQPYTDHTEIRVPFQIAISAGSLMRYYRTDPQPAVRDLIVSMVDDIVENCYFEDMGVFYAKELPSLRRINGNPVILEALAAAFELTGDTAYLEKGMDTFREIVEGRAASGRHPAKVTIGDAVVEEGIGTKTFAQAFYPLVSFYKAVTETGAVITCNFTWRASSHQK